MKLVIRKNRRGKTTSMRITATLPSERKDLLKFVEALAEPRPPETKGDKK